jgi:hypothetical protein
MPGLRTLEVAALTFCPFPDRKFHWPRAATSFRFRHWLPSSAVGLCMWEYGEQATGLARLINTCLARWSWVPVSAPSVALLAERGVLLGVCIRRDVVVVVVVVVVLLFGYGICCRSLLRGIMAKCTKRGRKIWKPSMRRNLNGPKLPQHLREPHRHAWAKETRD